ncbi:MAG: hypothetical protein EPO65_00615 [Dehalococcoidia bacterium]|nr:MAG: hypothetical protein EPO65_00615 [Dehalococcoidia bacterium]
MAKQSGLGDNLYIAGYDVSGDIGSLSSIAGPRGVTDVTGIDKSAFERLLLGKDGSIEFSSWFNPSAGQAHDRLEDLPTTDQILTYCRGTTLGNPAAAMVAKQINYDGTRAADGAFSFNTSAQANGYGLEWGRQLTAGKRTDTTATNGTGVDHTDVSTAFGWQAYLHVFSFTGTSVTVTLQDSADNSSFAAITGGAFTAATGVTSQRLEGARDATVRRYVRVATSGTFTSAVFAVMFVRNTTSVVF